MSTVLAGVTLGFGHAGRRVEVLRGVDLALEPGQVHLVRGPSGCGKSTLLHVAGGLLAPATGTVTIDGTDVYALSAAERAALRGREVGFVFQDFQLLPYLDVRDNILLPSLTAPVAAERLEAVVRRFGLVDRLDHPPGKLSIGERQRVALARAVVAGPKLVLADEPTGNLDDANTVAATGLLRELAGDGAAVLIATHDPRLEGIADHRHLMKDGRLA